MPPGVMETHVLIQLYPHITADTAILLGQPVIEGTRVPVSVLVAQVAAGKSFDDVAREQGVTTEDVRAALEYAASKAAEPVDTAGNGNSFGQTGDRLSPAGEEAARRLGLDPAALSPLGRSLIEQRAKIIASGIPLLTWNELDAEMAEQRGNGAE